QSAWWARRLGMVRLFARYRSAVDPRTEIPPQGLIPASYRRKAPYIYNDRQVEQLLQAAGQLPSATGLRAATYTTLVGLLAVTGMRMGEAIDLDREDVDLDADILLVQRTKFGKSRLVPIHASTHQALADYQALRDEIYPQLKTPSCLVSEHGRRLAKTTVRGTFAELSRQIGLRGPCDRRGPRLHDFRHRFAVRTLLNWYRTGVDVERNLPKLATYLGHTHVSHTYWYLSAVPELLQWASLRREQGHYGGPRP
ncbi:MAG: tyrosine-type recombinase/integrase, partial [bacterium]|nr:tyrosine-type recombinase/integrase [bacterium]